MSSTQAHPGRRRRHRRRRHRDARASCPARGRLGRDPAGRLARSAGKVLRVRGEDVVVQALAPEVFDGVDVAMFDVPDEVSRAVGADRGRARRGRRRQLRRVPDGPRRAAGRARGQPGAGRATGRSGIIANPNCTTLSMMAAMGALHARVRADARWSSPPTRRPPAPARPASTRLYDELAVRRRRPRRRPARRRRARRGGRQAGRRTRRSRRRWRSTSCRGPGSLKDDGWTLRGAEGPQRVPQDPRHPRPEGVGDLRAGAGDHHALAGRARDVRARGRPSTARAGAPRGARPWSCCDDPAAGEFPTPADVVGTDPTYVGRIRQALDFPNTLELFVCGDNLRKGAALNTAEIAELVAEELTAGSGEG